MFSQKEPSKVDPPVVKSASVDPTEDSSARSGNGPYDSLPPGAVTVTPEKQQVIGVRTGVVEKAAVEHFIRTVGRIAPDEKRVYRLVAGIDGWIRETYNNDTGTLVKKDERLASFYSPLFRAAQLAYLAVLSSPETLSGRRKASARAVPAGKCQSPDLYRRARKPWHERTADERTGQHQADHRQGFHHGPGDRLHHREKRVARPAL